MESGSPRTTAAIRWTQRFVLGALGQDVARSRRTSCLILLAVFGPLGAFASVAFRAGNFGSPVSIAGLVLTTVIVTAAFTTRHDDHQHRWGAIVVLIAIDQALGFYQLGPYGTALLPEVSMLGVWAALYLPTRVVRLAVLVECSAMTVTLIQAEDRLMATVAVIVAQITLAAVTILVHTAVLTLRATNDDLDAARRLAHELATTDALTGAANRRSFTERVAAIAAGPRTTHTLLLVDIDRFKRLNDHHGHLAGDEVLRAVVQRLSAALPDSSVARWGGEEFAVLCASGQREQSPSVAAEALRTMVGDEPIHTAFGPLSCTVSVGATVWDSTEPFEEALRRADDAMYDAKARGRDRSVERRRDIVARDDVRRPA